MYMAFIRGHWNAESGLVFNEHSLKLLMLELCARENPTCGKGKKPLAEVSKLILRVLCPNRFTGKDEYASLRWNPSLDCFFPPSGSAAHAMGWTYKYCTVLNKMLCEATPLAHLSFFKYLRSTPRRPLAFSARRRSKMALKRYDITTEQTGLASYWEVYMSTHTRQSQWYTKQSSETYMEWRVAFSL